MRAWTVSLGMRRLPMTRISRIFWPTSLEAAGGGASWATSGAAGKRGARKRTKTRERLRSRRRFLHGTCGEPALQEITEKICTPSLLKIGPFVGKRRLYQRDSRGGRVRSRVESR